MRRTILLLAALAVAADWPRFRGPNGTGLADDAIPTTFKEGDGILWKVPLPGTGNSSPVVVGGRIYLLSALPNGGERMLLCLDAKDGHTIWSRSTVTGTAKKHPRNSFASSTPAVEGDRVFALFWDGERESLHAYDLAGTFKWKKDLGAFKSQHGCGASPVAYAGTVLLNHDQDSDAKLMAFAADDGRELWSAPRKGVNACYTSPILRSGPNGSPEVVLFSTSAVTGYDLTSGRPNWNWDWDWGGGEQLRTVASPVMWNDVVFAHGGNGGGSSRTVAIKTGKSPQVLWEKNAKGGFPYVPCMLVRGDRLYTVTDKGIAGCFDPKTGKELWSQRLGGGFSASPVIAGGNVFAINEEGTVYVYPAADKAPAEVTRNALSEQVYASPAVADGRMYVRGEKHLFCIGK